MRIDTHSWHDIEISAIRGGTRIVGVISAAQDGTLALSEDLLHSDGRLQLVARIEGRRDEFIMQPMRIPAGD